MLCYAYDILKFNDKNFVNNETFNNIYNLLARIYLRELQQLIKRGLNKYYIEEKEDCTNLKGKININESIKNMRIHKGSMICEYDEYSENILINQIILATINLFLRFPKLDVKLKRDLITCRQSFFNINSIKLSSVNFSNIKFSRTNKHYKILINISELLYNGLIANEDINNIEFLDFFREKQMDKVYEKFVLNFYKHNLNAKEYHVHAPIFQWVDQKENKNISLLPRMETDIVIEDKNKNVQLIIDTKYYVKALLTSNWSEKEKIRSSHLYQIYSYVSRSNYSGIVNGMLLYPTVNEEINANYEISEHKISIMTLNLNTEWDEIEARLMSFIK